jgi:hypothetical protein
MEVRRGSVYLYEFENYDKLSMDLEILIEVNNEYLFTLYSRLPTRRLIEKLDLSKLDHHWITNNGGKKSIKPSIDKIIKSIKDYNLKDDRIYFLDGLEHIYNNSNKEELLTRLAVLSDEAKVNNYVIVYCINSLAFDSEWIIKLRHMAEKMEIKSPHSTAVVAEAAETDQTPLPDDEETIFELAIDGGPRLTYLARLPRTGFTNQILVKRILQWRRMGLDVSRIEPALSYTMDKAYELYKSVEEDVRKATELERFIHVNQEKINTVKLATDMFKIRQLTGLDEIERYYYKLS